MKPFCWYPALVGVPSRLVVYCPACGVGYSHEVLGMLNVFFKHALGTNLPKARA